MSIKIEQIYTACLSQGSYFIRSGEDAAIVDPLRETEPYLELAEKEGVKIKYIFETHFHADFVSGHLDLAEITGATIVYGPGASTSFNIHSATDGEEFPIGDHTIVALHTPGHTLESTSYLLKDKKGKELALFTGDTLFLGDVGRPDLAQDSSEYSMQDLAGMLYDSLQEKILPLPDDVVVYPGHGAGSACGKKMMDKTVDTLGNQKKVNYALKTEGKEEFIRVVTEGLEAPPSYFPDNVQLNKEGYTPLEKVMKKSLNPLNPERFETVVRRTCATILDTRDPGEFSKGFVCGALNIGLCGQFAPWVGALLENVNKPLVLVCEPGKEKESIRRLARVGFDRVLGYLEGGMESWVKSHRPVDTIDRITAADFISRLTTENWVVWDVRRPVEYKSGRVKGAINLPLNIINEWSCKRFNGRMAAIYCAGGYRSMIAASILKARGVHHFVEVEGGYKKLVELNPPLEIDEPSASTGAPG